VPVFSSDLFCEECEAPVQIAPQPLGALREGATVYVRLVGVSVDCPQCQQPIRLRNGVYEISADRVVFVRNVPEEAVAG
jgi:hypothetical protein